MTFLETDIKGCYKITYDKKEDSRGDFTRMFCREDLFKLGIIFKVQQSSLTNNRKKGTARGLHYQAEPYGENKIIVCTHGSIDVIVQDINDKDNIINVRLNSRLSSTNSVFVPKNCASGYVTLEDDSQVLYYMDQAYHQESQKIIPLSIKGMDNVIMSDKDSKAREKK